MDFGVPERTVRGWRQADVELDDLFFKARLDGAQAKLDVYEDALVEAKDSGDRTQILAADKLLGHARWEAEKLLSLFQPVQKSQVENIGPMVIGWVGEMDEKTNTVDNHLDSKVGTIGDEPREVH